MTWINIFIPNMRAPEFINSEPAARSTWLSVLAFCCEQENGGVIIGAEQWTDRAWLQTCGVTAEEVRKSAPLVSFENGNVTVWNYPEEKEKEVQLKRKAGKRGGLAKAANKGAASCATSRASGVLQAEPVAVPVAVLLRKGREEELEGKENEEGREEEPPKPPAEKPKRDNCPTAPQAKRFADMFGRKHSTAWSLKEIAAYKALGIIPEDDMVVLEKYYASGEKYLRKDLGTLLNNFAGELDRARKMFSNEKPKPPANYEDPMDTLLKQAGLK